MVQPRSSKSDLIASLTQWHAILFTIGTSWMFGGRIHWAQMPLCLWGSLAFGLTLVGFIKRRNESRPLLRPFLWILPGLLLAGWILAATFNPNFHIVSIYDSQVFRPIEPFAWLPSAAKIPEARSKIWLFMGLYVTGFNIALNINSLSRLHRLLLALAINTAVIAVFGTLQKLLGFEMFFGLARSPNPAFFGSFIYHNHWGAFALLGIAMWLANIPWLAAKGAGRSFWESPATGALTSVLIIAAAIPLSTSRASTMMLAIVVLGAAIHQGVRMTRTARRDNRDPRLQLSLLAVGLIACASAAYYVGSDVIQQRLSKTREQLSVLIERGNLGDRSIIYKTTIEIWKDKPIAGWGLESWELLHRRRTPLTHYGDHIQIYYDQAHSDWLQSLAEVGAVGTTLLVAMGLVPLWSTRRRLFSSSFTGYVLAVQALILLYAWIEFPLANPAVVLTFWIAYFAAMRHAQLGSST